MFSFLRYFLIPYLGEKQRLLATAERTTLSSIQTLPCSVVFGSMAQDSIEKTFKRVLKSLSIITLKYTPGNVVLHLQQTYVEDICHLFTLPSPTD